MLKTGLCSITFRELTVDAVIQTACEARLDGIEWGGDVHVPPGDIARAKDVRAKTEAAGLSVCSYGSYFRCDNDAVSITEVLDTALALGAGVIRVWAGKQGSDKADSHYRKLIAATLQDMVQAASKAGMTIALEYHGGTLTDTQTSAHQLLKEVGLPELKLYWQPRTGGTFEDDISELKAALPALSHVHCFHWGPGGGKDRRELAEGIAPWTEYLKLIRQTEGDRYIIHEFVRDDSPAQLRADAKTLHDLLRAI